MRKNKGFTLIELLVVVAIISLLASVVFASLTSARNKGKDADIKEEVSQLVTLMNLNYNDYGSYCQLDPGGWVTTCSSMPLSGTYASQDISICNNILKNAVIGLSGGSPLLVFVSGGSTCANSYSIMAGLNDGNWYCSGSSGVHSEYSNYDGNNPCCYNKP